jgi:hypothetical protein
MSDHIPDPTKMIRDTPISDSTPHNIAELGMLCRRLERELTAANEMFRKLNIHALNLTDRIRRLEEAGDVLCAAAAFMGWHMEIEKWNKAKEAKP